MQYGSHRECTEKLDRLHIRTFGDCKGSPSVCNSGRICRTDLEPLSSVTMILQTPAFGKVINSSPFHHMRAYNHQIMQSDQPMVHTNLKIVPKLSRLCKQVGWIMVIPLLIYRNDGVGKVIIFLDSFPKIFKIGTSLTPIPLKQQRDDQMDDEIKYRRNI